MKINYRCRNCFYYPSMCENKGRQRLGSSQICKYFKLEDIKAEMKQEKSDTQKHSL